MRNGDKREADPGGGDGRLRGARFPPGAGERRSASRAGVGKGTVYLYFPTKDDLHRGALEASLERVAIELEAAAAADAPARGAAADRSPSSSASSGADSIS
jgi:hypothetical protein